MSTPERPEYTYSQQLSELYYGAFENWSVDQNAFQTLDIPNSIANVFIPQRILELSNSPSNVRAVYVLRDDASYVTIAEHMPNGLTDEKAFEKWMEETNGKVLTSSDPYMSTDAPEGIDYMHASQRGLVDAGVVGLDDKIYLHYGMKKSKDYSHVIETINLFDRPELHGQGIGSSFYSRLESILKALGFEYLAGQIWSPNPGFFAKSRKPYDEFGEEEKEKLPPHFARSIPNERSSVWMIKKL